MAIITGGFFLVLAAFIIFKIYDAVLKYFILYERFRIKGMEKLQEKLLKGELDNETLNIYKRYTSNLRKYMVLFLPSVFIFLFFKELFDENYTYAIDIGIKLGFIGSFLLISLVYMILLIPLRKKIKSKWIVLL